MDKKYLIVIILFILLIFFIFLYTKSKFVPILSLPLIYFIISKEQLNNNITGGYVKPKNLKFYNISKNKKYYFDFYKLLDIPEATAMTFIKNNFIIITKPGKILYITKDTNNKFNIKEIFDMNNIEDFTSKDTEEGLLGITINSDNNKLYICYTIDIKNDKEYVMSLIVDEYDINNEMNITKNKNIIKIPYINNYHHGGTLEFGPDDKLYLSTGDGGPQGDPNNEAQNPNSLRGKLLRIDLKTNKPEIVAMGLRNPWKYSFDDSKQIFIGDVGWNSVEKVCLIKDLNKTYNFGWNYFEGSKQNKQGKKFTDFDPHIFEYPISDKTGRSVIGGYFINKLNIYVFADYLGFVRAIEYDGTKWWETGNSRLSDKNELIYSLGYDGNKIYVLTDKCIYSLEIKNN